PPAGAIGTGSAGRGDLDRAPAITRPSNGGRHAHGASPDAPAGSARPRAPAPPGGVGAGASPTAGRRRPGDPRPRHDPGHGRRADGHRDPPGGEPRHRPAPRRPGPGPAHERRGEGRAAHRFGQPRSGRRRLRAGGRVAPQRRPGAGAPLRRRRPDRRDPAAARPPPDLPACPDTGDGAFRGGRGMLNSALNFGPGCSVAAVEELTGVQIDHFMELDFEGFIAMVDALDGVPVCLPEALDDPAADLDLPAGEQVVGGKDALALARTRHAVGDGSDIARLGHQQMVMSAVVQEATSTGVLSRPDRLYAFLDATSSSLTVDPGLSRAADLAGLGTRISHVDPSRITFMTMPWEPAPTDRNRVV